MNENLDTEPQRNWWQDTVDCWRRLPNKAFFFILLAAWLALFQFQGNSIRGYVHTPSLFTWMVNQYDNPNADDSHGNFIPFLVIGLFWWKRHELLVLPLKLWWPGLVFLVLALLLHIFGYFVQQPYFSIAALFAGVFGLMGLAWGRDWLRHSLFPYCLFVFSVPLGSRGQIITFPLQRMVSWLTEKSAHVLGIDVIRVGTGLFDPSMTYRYEVAAACSGIRSLVTVILLATIIGFVFLRSPLNRILLILLALPFSILGNVLRVLLIIISAEIGGQKWGDYVHENLITSLLPYVPAFVGFLYIGFWMEKRELRKLRA